MWKTDASVKGFTGLNKPTKQFDACGVYDIKNGGAPIPNGSTKKEWANALDFLEWYGIPEMEGFGIIIVDDTNN